MKDGNRHWYYLILVVALVALGALFDYYVLEKTVGAAFCDSVCVLIIMTLLVSWRRPG